MAKPIYSLIATGLLLASAVALVLFADEQNQGTVMVLGLIVSTIPSLIASFSAERTARDVRNGVLVEKVKEGATHAINESGVVVSNGPIVDAQLRALSALLQQNTRVTQTNTQHLLEVDSEDG